MNFKAIIFGGGAAIAAITASAALAQSESSSDYAANAIHSGELSKAERLLQPASLQDAVDPARLINIATVYARTERYDHARAALLRVRELPDEQLDLANGASYSSHRIASAMLSRLDGR